MLQLIIAKWQIMGKSCICQVLCLLTRFGVMPGLSWDPTVFSVVWHQWVGQPGPCSAVLRDLKHQEPSKTVEQLAAPDPAAKFQHHQLKYFTWDPKNCRQHDQDMIQDNCRKARGWKVFRIQGHPRPLFQSWLKQCHDFKTWACASFAKNHWTEIRDCDRTDYQGFNQPKWGREIGAVIGNQPCSYAFSTHYMLCMPL